MDISAIRQQIPVTQNAIYMNTGWSGPTPAPALEAVLRRLEEESRYGPTAPPVLESSREIRAQATEAVAGLINASPKEVALTQNTTHGLNIILAGLPWRPGDEVITFDLEHPSVLVPALNLQRRFGVKTHVLPLAPDEDHDSIVEKVAAAMNENTRLLFFSHIQFASGLRMPLERLRDVAYAHGARLLVDGAQTLGHIVLDMEALNVDFYSMAGHKWLLAPDGIGVLYVRQEALPIVEPIFVSGRAFSEYDVSGHMVPAAEEITKFNLTSSSTAHAVGLRETVCFLQAAGMAEIEQRARSLGAMAIRRLAEIPGVTVFSPQALEACSGLVTFGIAAVDPETAVTRMWQEANIIVRHVHDPAGIRLSLDFFNTEEEIETVLSVVERMSTGG